MNEDLLIAIESKKYLDDQIALSQIQQLAFGKAVSTIVSTPIVPTADTNLYSTSTYGVSPQRYYKKAVVSNAELFMDDNLKISEASPYATSSNNMHKLDDMSHISSRYAITEYFNVMYYNKLLTPGSKCNYETNDTKNVVKHLNFLTQTIENIVQQFQHKGSFPIGRIVYKWEKLHKALI